MRRFSQTYAWRSSAGISTIGSSCQTLRGAVEGSRHDTRAVRAERRADDLIAVPRQVAASATPVLASHTRAV